MKRTADRLFGKDYLWSVLAGGRHQMNFCTAAAMIGGNVRVGLEDSLYIGPGKLAKSNAEQVAKIRRIVEDLGYEIATPAEARQMLGLKGARPGEVLDCCHCGAQRRSNPERIVRLDCWSLRSAMTAEVSS